MKLSYAISKISPVRGYTSVIEAMLSGNTDSVTGQSRADEGLEEARARLAAVHKAQAECKSDAAYWGYQGDISYWQTVVYLLEASAIAGPDNLPDLPYNQRDGMCVMDICSMQENWGKAVLAAAKQPPVSSGSET